jgi:hypothetical protein
MLPSLQPHRPKVSSIKCFYPSSNDIQLPKSSPKLQQEQIRHKGTQDLLRNPPSNPSSNHLGNQNKPRSQLEAMPPFAPLPHLMTRPIRPAPYSSATCHPVFFTQTLLKPPFPLPIGPGAATGLNPVAFGYIPESGARRPSNEGSPRTKL